MFVLNTLCMTYFVTLSVAVFKAAIWVKINVYHKIVMKKRKKGENMEIEGVYT